MVVDQEVMDALKTIGLNLYERKLWVSLLSKNIATAGELTDISGVPRSRCYDVLESLANKGFVIVQPSKPMKYVAIEPAEALERAKKKMAQEALEMTERIDRFKTSPMRKQLEKLHKKNISSVKPENLAGTLHGKFAFHEHMGSMIKGAKNSINMVLNEDDFKELMEKHSGLIQKAGKSGVKINIAAPVTQENKDMMKSLKKYASIKDISNVEHLQEMAGKFAVIDDNQVLMSLTDNETHPTQTVGFWSSSDHLSREMMRPMFNLIWKHSKEVK